MLRSFLPSVVRFSEADGAVVYVADNGSTDASVDMLCREFLTVRLILLEENQGFADGYACNYKWSEKLFNFPEVKKPGTAPQLSVARFCQISFACLLCISPVYNIFFTSEYSSHNNAALLNSCLLPVLLHLHWSWELQTILQVHELTWLSCTTACYKPCYDRFITDCNSRVSQYKMSDFLLYRLLVSMLMPSSGRCIP